MRNKLLMRNCFNFLVTQYPSKEEIERFCLKNYISVQYFEQSIQYYLDTFANSVDKQKFQQYLYLFKYDMTIQNILSVKSKEERIGLLMENIELYGTMRQVYLKKYPEQEKQIRKLDIEYREAIDLANQLKQKAYRTSSEKENSSKKYINIIESLLNIVEEKMQNQDYYVEEELSEARKYNQMLVGKYKKEREQYNKRITQYYNVILKSIIKDFSQDKEHYSMVDYYYKTNVLPSYLFRRADFLDKKIAERTKELGEDLGQKKNIYKTLKKTILKRITNSNTYLTTPMMITRKQASAISQYMYQGVTLDCHDLEQIYDFMIEEGLPNYEILYFELLKECTKKGKLVSRKEKNNFVKKLEKRVS